LRVQLLAAPLSSHTRRDVVCLSVRPSVCHNSQVGDLLNRLNVGSRKQRHTTAQGMWVSDAENFDKTQTESPSTEAPNAGGGSCKLATFDAKRCQLSSFASLSHWASTLFVCCTFAVMQRLSSTADRCWDMRRTDGKTADHSTSPYCAVHIRDNRLIHGTRGKLPLERSWWYLDLSNNWQTSHREYHASEREEMLLAMFRLQAVVRPYV